MGWEGIPKNWTWGKSQELGFKSASSTWVPCDKPSLAEGELEVDLPTRPLTHPPSLPPSLPASSPHPLLSPAWLILHFDKRDTEFIRRLRSNCLQAIFTLFAFITSLMRLIMGLLCAAAPAFFFSTPFSSTRFLLPPPQLLHTLFLRLLDFIVIILITRF